MHSIRMHTVRCSGRLPMGWGYAWMPGECLPRWGICLGEDVCLGGVCEGGCIAPVNRTTDRCKTGVKHNLSTTTVADAKNTAYPEVGNANF